MSENRMKLSREKEDLLQELLLLKTFIAMQYEKVDDVMDSLRGLEITDEELNSYDLLDMK